MELILACSIGILFASGIWLILRPRSFQVIIGLLLLSYAVNLFLFITGKIQVNRPPFANETVSFIEGLYADPLPQALVLTAIVIGFATSALYLVVLLGSRGLTGTDHVDGKEQEHDE